MAAGTSATQRYPVLARVPHALSGIRVLLTAATYVAAFRGDRPLFAVLVLLAVLTDIMDGPVARATGSASLFGANLDSAADLFFYISLPAWAYLLVPQIVLAYLPLIFAFAVLFLLANALTHAAFGALGVHNRFSRASGTAGVAATFYAILWGMNVFLQALVIVVLAADLSQRYFALARHWLGMRPRRR